MQLETLVREFLFECEIREYTPRTVKQDETYKNLRLDHTGATIEISLGEASFQPVG